MSSLLQFAGETSRSGVHLQFILVEPDPVWVERGYPPNDDEDVIFCRDVEHVPCTKCSGTHAQIYIAVRKPVGMLGCWVQFRYNGAIHAPDLSIPISVRRLPHDARPLTNEQNAQAWHS